MESILTSIKKLLGITEEYKHFDTDLIIYINSAIAILAQIGVGPPEGFRITSNSETWIDYLGANPDPGIREMAETYIGREVKLQFDPPTNTPLIDVVKNSISELEWRLGIVADTE